jgi:acyl carrier protein
MSIIEITDLIASTLNLPKEKISEASKANDFNEWDSLGQLRVCMAIEEKYNVKIDIDLMPDLNSVKNIITFLEQTKH